MQSPRALAVLLLVVAACGPSIAAEPMFTLGEEGRTFLYRARPGDLPATVAEMFGIPQHDLAAFLAANGISDATRVGAGFVYRIPNAAARALAERTSTLEKENASLQRTAREEKERAQGFARTAEDARAEAAASNARVAQLAGFERLWPLVKGALLLLLGLASAAGYTAFAALRRRTEAERYARTLARELEEKRKASLGERQESARRNLELENRVRTLEGQIGPRVVLSGRGGN
jgi:hypothetical protein